MSSASSRRVPQFGCSDANAGTAMSSRRREKERDATRMRMDGRAAGRSGRATSPPKRRELDTVMKKARSRDAAAQSSYWNKKLLEVEEKDPNRWRHSGYKELYGAAGSPNGGGKRSRSRSRTKIARRAKSRSRERRPQTPQPTTSRAAASGSGRPATRKPVSASSSRSLSSCSDDSCSVCSPKPRVRQPSVPVRRPSRSRSRSFSVPRSKAANTRERRRSSPPRDPRAPPSPAKPAPRPPRTKSSKKARRKTKPTRRPPVLVVPEAATRRHASPASVSSESSSAESNAGASKLTLSERFGKMAQWSVDRRDMEDVKNMRITKDSDGADLKVVIEENRPMPLSDRRVGAGYYPEELHSAPIGLEAWDDVRVRYKYYKQRGYLRDLTLDDYMRWEEWWYKYQEWLEAERWHERWAAFQRRRR